MIEIPAAEIKKGLLVHLDNIVGPDGYSTRNLDRLTYTRDSNFRSAIQAHYGVHEHFPSIIVWPETTEQISQLIKAAIKYRLSITPFGGGSGVCGAALSYNGGMILDLKRMNKVLRLDEDRLFVEVQSGIIGQNLENELARKGFTLGHFPSSIMCASLGGYLATRSAGQLSSKYGKIEDMVIDFEFVDGTGQIHQTIDVSRHRGFDFTQAVIGSEGTLGIITKSRLRIYPLPTARTYRAFRFPRMEYGMEALRRIMQTGIKPDVLRLYDEIDTAIMIGRGEKSKETRASLVPDFAKKIVEQLKSKSQTALLHAHRIVNELAPHAGLGSMLVIMLEGSSRIIEKQMKLIQSISRGMDAADLGEDPAIYWHKHRYSVSYKASKLFTDGAFTDTMETATTWKNLHRLYDGVRNAVKGHCLVLAHISHVYSDGAAIYFTFVSPLMGLRLSLKNYDRIWQRALSAVHTNGGVISHHHGIGKLKAQALTEEWGEARTLYRQMKEFFDPYHILNPNVLINNGN